MSNLGNKKTMAQNIQYYMKLHNKTRNDICEALGIKYTTFTDWVKGNTYPRIDKIELMANYFGIEKSDLVEDIRHRSAKTGVKINVLGEVAAGILIEAIENIVDTEEIPETLAKTGEFFGLKIKGDSMAPRITEGDTVIVRKQEDADSGDVVIALINGDSATCKKLIKYTHGISLVAFNPTYDPLTFTNKEIQELPVRIIGKVIENRQKY